LKEPEVDRTNTEFLMDDGMINSPCFHES